VVEAVTLSLVDTESDGEEDLVPLLLDDALPVSVGEVGVHPSLDEEIDDGGFASGDGTSKGIALQIEPEDLELLEGGLGIGGGVGGEWSDGKECHREKDRSALR
jgi:hypothetical protein